jgi:hypothetical protein
VVSSGTIFVRPFDQGEAVAAGFRAEGVGSMISI